MLTRTNRVRRIMEESTTVFSRQICVHYPLGSGPSGAHLVLRTELDWDVDLEPTSVSNDGDATTFHVEASRPFLYFKPCLRLGSELRWSVGPNTLALMTTKEIGAVYPYFEGDERGTFSELIEIDSAILGRKHRLRVYLPAGYAENPLRRYTVFYMQDGKNLFFPAEAFQGRDWQVDDTLHLLDDMSIADRLLVVGIYSEDRAHDYTKPGYEAYARSVVEEIRPVVAHRLRTFDTPRETAVGGSSLGGVVSFYMAWQYPQVFGYAACLSTPFSYKDDLIERVLSEPKSTTKFYLDSGWPGDNYEVTLAMAMALVERGYRPREDFLHLAFPLDEHDEQAWGRRLHLPIQLALSKPELAHRRHGV
jgi:predicted alpha/beta superfamily hydrolase